MVTAALPTPSTAVNVDPVAYTAIKVDVASVAPLPTTMYAAAPEKLEGYAPLVISFAEYAPVNELLVTGVESSAVKAAKIVAALAVLKSGRVVKIPAEATSELLATAAPVESTIGTPTEVDVKFLMVIVTAAFDVTVIAANEASSSVLILCFIFLRRRLLER
jgi:hypothetical protein